MAEYDDAPVPVDDDIRHDDEEFDPRLEPRKAKAWLNLLIESEKAFESWNDHCDNIDKLYGSLERLADGVRDKQFQMFWANCEILKPAIYAKAPVPVVVTKWKDRRPVYQAAAELMERCATVAFDLAYVNDVMLQLRDDVILTGRGVPWCRYESGKKNDRSGGYYNASSRERVCIDFKHRRDFLHSVSRCWYEVTWVAAASYLTRAEARARFYRYSGDEYQDAEYKVDKDAKEVGGADARERACFWEIWHKGEQRVVWVAQGCENILDEDDPHLELEGFFPCPKPAYGVMQRGSLVPVPDAMQYKDQLDEINLLTGRIHALGDALEVKGFYPAGGGEIGDAVQQALRIKTPGRVLVPISNWAAFGGSKEIIVWMPIDVIAQTINTCVTLRKQLIDDIYQIVGLADIMRGATDPEETYGAQKLKTNYGSSRVRDKQYELIRIARDLVCIVCEIICQKFDQVTMVEMSQSLLPTKAMQQQAVMQLQQQVQQQSYQYQQMAASPQAQQLKAQNPDQADQLMQQAQQQLQAGHQAIQQLAGKPTIEQVFTFLRDNRARCFTLDIETDSTIMPDENADKERRSEFVQMLSVLLPQIAQMVAAEPATADFCGQLLKFSVKPFRAGRELDGAIDDLVAQMQAKVGQPKGDDPTTSTNKTALQIEQLKAQRESERDKANAALKAQELQLKDKHETMKVQSAQQIEMMKLQSKQGEDAAKAAAVNQKAMAEREAHQMDMLGRQAEAQADQAAAQQKMALAAQQARHKEADMAARASERQAMAAMRQPPQPQGPPGGL